MEVIGWFVGWIQHIYILYSEVLAQLLVLSAPYRHSQEPISWPLVPTGMLSPGHSTLLQFFVTRLTLLPKILRQCVFPKLRYSMRRLTVVEVVQILEYYTNE
jgi:hypothetical protein